MRQAIHRAAATATLTILLAGGLTVAAGAWGAQDTRPQPQDAKEKEKKPETAKEPRKEPRKGAAKQEGITAEVDLGALDKLGVPANRAALLNAAGADVGSEWSL